MEYTQHDYFSHKDFINEDERDSIFDKSIPYYFDLTKYNYCLDEIPNILSNILSNIFINDLNLNDIYKYKINDYNNFINILLKIKLNNKTFVYYGNIDINV